MYGASAMDPPSNTIWVGNLPIDSDEASITAIFAAYSTIARVKPLPISKGKGAAIIQLMDVADATWIVENLNGNIAQGLTEPVIVKFARPQGAARPGMSSVPTTITNTAFRYSPYNDGYVDAPQVFGYADPPHVIGASTVSTHIVASTPSPVSAGVAAMMGMFAMNGTFPQMDPSTLVQLCISGLPPDTTDKDLYRMLAPYGCPIKPDGVKAMLNENGQCTGIGYVDVYDFTTAQMAMSAMNNTLLPNGKVLMVQQNINQAPLALPAPQVLPPPPQPPVGVATQPQQALPPPPQPPAFATATQPQIMAQQVPQQMTQSMLQHLAQPLPQPAAQPLPQPVPQPLPQPLPQPVAQPAAQPVPQAVPPPVPVPPPAAQPVAPQTQPAQHPVFDHLLEAPPQPVTQQPQHLTSQPLQHVPPTPQHVTPPPPQHVAPPPQHVQVPPQQHLAAPPPHQHYVQPPQLHYVPPPQPPQYVPPPQHAQHYMRPPPQQQHYAQPQHQPMAVPPPQSQAYAYDHQALPPQQVLQSQSQVQPFDYHLPPAGHEYHPTPAGHSYQQQAPIASA